MFFNVPKPKTYKRLSKEDTGVPKGGIQDQVPVKRTTIRNLLVIYLTA